jgi:pimeloyl-ACP methyl ester carboxylesterase
MGGSVSTWRLIMPDLSMQTRVCAYDRAGLGFSDPPTVRPRTSRDVALDLHKLLAVAREAGPYVLVGHSIGGYHVRVYAAQFPDEVVGVVLVDSSHPDQVRAFLDSLPPADPNEPEEWQAYRAQMDSMLNDPSSNPEDLDIAASAAQVRASGDLGDVLLVVVTANQGIPPSASEIQADLYKRLSQVWLRLQADLVGLSPQGTQVFATRGGHYVQEDDPEVVMEAIQRVIQAARK